MFMSFSEVPEDVPYYIYHCQPEQANINMQGFPAIRRGWETVQVRLANNLRGWETLGAVACPADHHTALRKMIREDGDD